VEKKYKQGIKYPRGDLRSNSGAGTGDGIENHTEKWLSGGKAPIQWIAEAAPIEVQTRVAQCWGGGDVALGHPIEYISLDGTTPEDPAVCKYCGLRFFLGGQH